MNTLTLCVTLLLTVSLCAAWWWWQRPVLTRRWVYGATALFFIGSLLAAKYLPDSWFVLRFSCLLMASGMFFVLFLMLTSEGANEPRCRKRARLAALPPRPIEVASLPCCLSGSEMLKLVNERLREPEPVGNGGVCADYEDEYRNWELAIYPIGDDKWVLLLWSYLSFELRDSEVAAICRRHVLPISPDFIGREADAMGVCCDGMLHLYPAEAADDVKIVLAELVSTNNTSST